MDVEIWKIFGGKICDEPKKRIFRTSLSGHTSAEESNVVLLLKYQLTCDHFVKVYNKGLMNTWFEVFSIPVYFEFSYVINFNYNAKMSLAVSREILKHMKIGYHYTRQINYTVFVCKNV